MAARYVERRKVKLDSPFWRFAIRIPAALALAGLLVILVAAATPGLLHGDHLGHCCQFCHLGHAPLLKPAPGLVFHAPPANPVWFSTSVSIAEFSHSLAAAPARAPPSSSLTRGL